MDVMKKLLVTLTASCASLAALAQGKISFANDTLHLVYWGPQYGSYAGTAVNSNNIPPGVPGIVADLYMGTSSSTLYLYTRTAFLPATSPGRWNQVSLQVNTNPITG